MPIVRSVGTHMKTRYRVVSSMAPANSASTGGRAFLPRGPGVRRRRHRSPPKLVRGIERPPAEVPTIFTSFPHRGSNVTPWLPQVLPGHKPTREQSDVIGGLSQVKDSTAGILTFTYV